jgi:hypothetical protein
MRALNAILPLLGAAVVAVSACHDTANVTGADQQVELLPARDASPVQTDSARYHLRRVPGGYEANVVATFVNPTTGPLYYSRCSMQSPGPMYSVRRTGQDSAAVARISTAWACFSADGVLAAGDTIKVAVWLGSADAPNTSPAIKDAERIGQFRVELPMCSAPSPNPSACALLPQAQRQSNAFDVVFER